MLSVGRYKAFFEALVSANRVFLFYTFSSKTISGQQEKYFKKPREFFIQDRMEYKKLLQFLKIHHG